jgi:hypothetical protein
VRVILLTRDNRHYVLTGPAIISMGEVYGTIVTGGTVQVPVSNYSAQEIYRDSEIETFRMRHRELEEAAEATP